MSRDSFRPCQKRLRLATLAGVVDTPFSTLTGGAFSTFLALALGAGPLTIGLLAALPSAAALAPLAVSSWLDRAPRRRVAIVGLGLARLLWLAPLGLLLVPPEWPRGTLFLVAAALSALAGAAGGLAWLGWLAAMVPARIRGRYFGGRGFATGLVSAVASACAGPLLDGRLAAWVPGGTNGGLFVVFGLAVGFGLASVAALARIREGRGVPTADGGRPEREVAIALAPATGRGSSLVRPAALLAAASHYRIGRYLMFGLLWNAALHIGGPFIPIYLLEELRLSAGTVGLLGTVTTGASLLTVRAWGRLADERGSLAVMLGTGFVAATVPAWWLAAGILPAIPFAVATHAASGVVWSGFNLAAGNLTLALVPRERNAVPLALIGAACGIGGAVGPVVGGLLLDWLQAHPGLAGSLGPYKTLFLLSSGCRLAAWALLLGVKEPHSLVSHEPSPRPSCGKRLTSGSSLPTPTTRTAPGAAGRRSGRPGQPGPDRRRRTVC